MTTRSNHVPLRRCRVCRTQKRKAELTRWVNTVEGLRRDDRKVAVGRGYYSCSERCAEIIPKTIKKK